MITPAQAAQIAALLDRALVEDYRRPNGGDGFRDQADRLARGEAPVR